MGQSGTNIALSDAEWISEFVIRRNVMRRPRHPDRSKANNERQEIRLTLLIRTDIRASGKPIV